MREQWYLCRVPCYDIVVLYHEKDYNYQRHHEANLRVRKPENAIVLVEDGSKREMDLLYNLAIERSN